VTDAEGVVDSACSHHRHSRILASRPRDAAVLIVDVDHLAAANERYGRPAGDRMLAATADIISVNLRP
jgi:GGDEF domain-containing protein